MAAYTAKDVSELRQRTQAGMMDCKKALEENAGNMDAAVEWLRKKGIARGENRAGRTASEGKIVSAISLDGSTGALVELNSETDFVARNDVFGQTATQVAATLLADTSADGVVANAEGAPLMQAKFGGSTLAESLKEFTGKIGENIVLRRYARLGGASGAVGAYVHHNGKVGALVELTGISGEKGQQLARTIGEHVVGAPTVPVAVTRDDVPAALVERERRIFAEQAAASGKPANIIEKMVGGRIDKYYKEVTLIDQPWVRDDSKTIGALLKDAGPGVSIRRFARFQIGQE